MTAAEVFSAVTKDMRSWLVCDPKPRCVGAIGAVTALRDRLTGHFAPRYGLAAVYLT